MTLVHCVDCRGCRISLATAGVRCHRHTVELPERRTAKILAYAAKHGIDPLDEKALDAALRADWQRSKS